MYSVELNDRNQARRIKEQKQKKIIYQKINRIHFFIIKNLNTERRLS